MSSGEKGAYRSVLCEGQRNTSRRSNPAATTTDAMRARNYAQHLVAYHAAQCRHPRPDGDMPWHRQGILLGVHAHSPFPDNHRKHVVFGKIDRRGAFIKRVVNYNQNGGSINPGFNGGITSVDGAHYVIGIVFYAWSISQQEK
ncbi:MAG: hypothetical protein M1816_006124 [Peltula sp. TS41687]|nr:MAG: hypothetical protein M1816_006124 [Peltula sp. TS41687]